ncbi:hypothetical protein ACE10X_13315 [Bradyrhizobium sp. Pha-3]|uniref:hypothetical protein n=1 Tax=Bradyrhizobium sp. Pha-3 TaxID=208375 RepID=UPI0035D40A15
MAALLKDPQDDLWSQPVSKEGLAKLARAIEQPKAPTESLKRLMSQVKESK